MYPQTRPITTSSMANNVTRSRPRRKVAPLLPLAAWPALVIVLGFLFSGPLLQLVDPVAAAVDIGVLSLVLLGLLCGLAVVVVSHWLLGLLWPVFRDFGRNHVESVFKSLPSWQKIMIYLGCYFLLVYALVCCVVAVF